MLPALRDPDQAGALRLSQSLLSCPRRNLGSISQLVDRAIEPSFANGDHSQGGQLASGEASGEVCGHRSTGSHLPAVGQDKLSDRLSSPAPLGWKDAAALLVDPRR